ncbi:P-loop containing nucleoside triphosphate hydrolase protein [Dichotomocladium elegans]|nr:P-loop containing nucleoside triphosphate hydrolase protein [Dichotomocladium elegans]
MVSKVFIIGISGPSCSGKTTVTRILEKLLKHTVVIYQDDYYKSDSEIPIDPETQLANWDCPDALDFDKMNACLSHVLKHKKLPDDFVSTEANNTHDGSTALSREALTRLAESLSEHLGDGMEETLFVIVDGFLLYWDMALISQIHCRAFFMASYETLKKRREERNGYLTPGGDPPGYFDDIVWPQYVRWNRHLLRKNGDSNTEHGTVEGVLTLDTDRLSIEESAQALVNKLKETYR